jgi:hypothetical protein
MDYHNKTIHKAQIQASYEARTESEEAAMLEQKQRAEQAVKAEEGELSRRIFSWLGSRLGPRERKESPEEA